MEHHHAVAEFVTGNIFAKGSYHSGGFMAEYPRGGVGAGGNLLQIGSANAAGVNPNKYLSRADLGNRHRLHANVINAAVNSRLHRGGDGSLTDGTTELGCARHWKILCAIARGTFSSGTHAEYSSIRCSNARHRFAEAILLFFLIFPKAAHHFG